MNLARIMAELERNQSLFKELFTGLSKKEYLWKPHPNKWCLLEIICHLYDEEREDFKTRIKHILETPHKDFIPIEPENWVKERLYLQWDFTDTLDKFLIERRESIKWLQSLNNASWDNTYQHYEFGVITAKMLLTNWLAHDYLHIKQITKLKFDYLKQTGNESLDYAGNWT